MDAACRVSKTLTSNPESAVQTHAREVLGLDPEDLGSPVGAAVSSFVSFAVGAVVPLAPFLLPITRDPSAWSALLAAIALFVVGVSRAR